MYTFYDTFKYFIRQVLYRVDFLGSVVSFCGNNTSNREQFFVEKIGLGEFFGQI